MLGVMIYRAEVLLLKSDELGTVLGNFETATRARGVCAQFEGGPLSWSQPSPELWEAQGRKRWYQVLISQ